MEETVKLTCADCAIANAFVSKVESWVSQPSPISILVFFLAVYLLNRVSHKKRAGPIILLFLSIAVALTAAGILRLQI